jgi:hypothetical protein
VTLLAAVVAGTCAPSAVAARRPLAPAISFSVKAQVFYCRDVESPRQVTTYWQISHRVSAATITGGVAPRGEAPKPVVIVDRPHRRAVHGATKVFVLCTGSAQVLTLAASGPGASSSATAIVHEAPTPGEPQT